METTSQLKAVVFDSDGTLMNTEELIIAAYQHVATQHELRPPSRDQIMVHMGKSLKEIYAGLFPKHPDHDQLVAANGAFILDHVLETQGYDGLEDLLRALRGDGLMLGLLTGGDHKVAALLEHHGIAHYFGSVVHSELIEKQKPDPEGLQLVLHELGVQPDQAVMVGDMRYDILAGKNAGVRATIGVTHGFGTRQELQQAGADRIVSNLPELLTVLQDDYLS